MIAGEEAPPYSRMAIPYLLQGNIKEPGTYLRQAAGHYDALGIKVVNGRAGGIDQVDARAKRLTDLADGGLQRLLHAGGALDLLTDQVDHRCPAGTKLQRHRARHRSGGRPGQPRRHTVSRTWRAG